VIWSRIVKLTHHPNPILNGAPPSLSLLTIYEHRQATNKYEEWLRQTHSASSSPTYSSSTSRWAAALFPFFRATFYRWVQVWPEVCPDLDRVPHLLSIGDLHVENFGTWRDIDGRLVWGVNDFDEACVYPTPWILSACR